MTMSHSIIFNPLAGCRNGADIVRHIAGKLTERGIDVRQYSTRSQGHGKAIARKVSGDSDVILAVGGDGTVNEVVSGMMSSNTSVPLAILPTGSGNDAVKCLSITDSADDCIEVMLSGRRRLVDVGRCNHRYFLNIMGVGFDAAVGHRMHQLRLKRGLAGGSSLYHRALLHCIMRYRSLELEVDIDGKVYRHRFFLVCIANGTTFGGDFTIAPMADMSSGDLTTVSIEHISKPRFFWHLGKVKKGKVIDLPEIRYRKSRKVRISSPIEIPAQLDGEYYAAKTFDVEILPGRLTVLVP